MSDQCEILAVIIAEGEEKWITGETVVFKAKDQAQKEETAILVGRMLQAVVHELPTGIYVVVRH